VASHGHVQRDCRGDSRRHRLAGLVTAAGSSQLRQALMVADQEIARVDAVVDEV